MTATLTFAPRALWLVALIAALGAVLALGLPRLAPLPAAQENTHLLPEAHAEFVRAFAALNEAR